MQRDGKVMPNYRQTRSRALWVGALALAIAGISGCSKDAKKALGGVTDSIDDKINVGQFDDLLDQVKGQGKGVVTGYLTGEGSELLSGALGKMASNAAGQQRMVTRQQIPLTGANILLFDALNPSTAAETTLVTDSLGQYTAVLDEGQYFGFAVYLDLNTFQLVTAAINDIRPMADSVVAIDTATAIEDATAPTVLSVYDATAPNESNIFLVSGVPNVNAKLNVVFSEPISRSTASGLVFGKLDTSLAAGTFGISDTVEVDSMTWNGDSRELTLHLPTLDTNSQYGVSIQTSFKDLAKNSMDKSYAATFLPVNSALLLAESFAVAQTRPVSGESIKPLQKPAVLFNRPVKIFTVFKNITIEPAVTGHWEVQGPKVIFHSKTALSVGTTYKVSVPTSVTDIQGNALGTATEFSFTVKDYEGAAGDSTKTDAERQVALLVEQVFEAYLQGDIGRFSSYFHENFRLQEGSRMLSRGEFLDMIRRDVAEKANQLGGYEAPVFDNGTAACQDSVRRWQVASQDGSDTLWVEAHVGIGASPRVWKNDAARTQVSSGIQWGQGGPSFTYNGKRYAFDADFSRFHIDTDGAMNDPRFFGDVLRKTSSVVLRPVKDNFKEEFKVDGGIKIVRSAATEAEGRDTAFVAVKSMEIVTRGRLNSDPGFICRDATPVDTNYSVIRFVLVGQGGKWSVVRAIGSGDDKVGAEQFRDDAVINDFDVQHITPIDLIAPGFAPGGVPATKVAKADGSVEFSFKGLAHDSVGGYLVGLAEDTRFTPGRPPYGLLMFVKNQGKGAQHRFKLKANAKPDSGATLVLKNVHELRLPGWDRTLYDFVLGKIHSPDSGLAGVYFWKVIAIKDSSAAQFLNNGFSMQRFYGESDFGTLRGYFAVGDMPQGNFLNGGFQEPMPPPGGMGQPIAFGDSDMDGVPDFIEIKYGTDAKDRSDYPDFRLDSDGDRIADFLEIKLGTPVDTANDYATLVARIRSELKIDWVDSDSDGFPDDIEQFFGFDPFNPQQNPGTRVRVDAPKGIFAGKARLGGEMLAALNFKVFTDSTGKLRVGYKLINGRDTLADTVRALFNDGMGELVFQIPILSGPNRGQSFLVRGHFDAFSALLQGPVDMVPTQDKESVAFGAGPYVGQFAASGRGDDVSHFLQGPSTGGGTGPVGPGPGDVRIGYREKPNGGEAADFVFFTNEAGKTHILVINTEFESDTLALLTKVDFHPQPDGSYDFFARYEVHSTEGDEWGDLGGRILKSAEGWIIDGHLYQGERKNGVQRDIPGQYSAKSAEIIRGVGPDITLAGTFTGWVQQDKNGTGLQGPGPAPGPGPGPNPDLGPVGGDPFVGDPGFGPPPMLGTAERLMKYLGEKLAVSSGSRFGVAFNGHILQILNDAAHIRNGMAPEHCHFVELLPDGESFPEGFPEQEKTKLTTGAVLIVLEDQYSVGSPALIDRMRDAQGNVFANLILVQPRQKASNMGTCPDFMQPMDPHLPPGDSGHVDPGHGPEDPQPYKGTRELVLGELQRVQNVIHVEPANKTTGVYETTVDASTLMKNQMGMYEIKAAARDQWFVVLAPHNNPNAVFGMEGKILMIEREVLSQQGPGPMPGDSTHNQPPPGDSTQPPPPGGNTQPDGPPPPYAGDLATVRAALTASQNVVIAFTGQDKFSPVMVLPETLAKDTQKGHVSVRGAADSNVYLFLSQGIDTQLMVTESGQPAVFLPQPVGP